MGEIGPKRRPEDRRFFAAIFGYKFYWLWRPVWRSQFVSAESRDFRVESVFVGETKSVSQSDTAINDGR